MPFYRFVILSLGLGRNIRTWRIYPPKKAFVVTPERFIEMYNSDPDSVKNAQILPPEIGSNDFGRFIIPASKTFANQSIED